MSNPQPTSREYVLRMLRQAGEQVRKADELMTTSRALAIGYGMGEWEVEGYIDQGRDEAFMEALREGEGWL